MVFFLVADKNSPKPDFTRQPVFVHKFTTVVVHHTVAGIY